MRKIYSKIKSKGTARLVQIAILVTLGIGNVWGQTTLISPTGDGGFETGTTLAANGWTAVNPSTDKWVAGTGTAASNGSRCGHISTNGTNWSYSQFSVFNHLYRDITLPAGEPKVTLVFKWKVGGEGTTTSDWDNMKVFLAPTSVTPTSTAAVTGATQLSGSGAISGMYKLSSAAWNTETISFVGVPGTTYRLIFQWKSDGTDIVTPPAALDEISLVSSAPGNITANTLGGLWSSPATWVGGVVPNGDNVTIPAGTIVTVDQITTINNLTIDGTLQWNATSTNAMTLNGNLLINSAGRFLPYTSTSTSTGVTVNIAGNFQNDGYTNLALSALSFNGSGSTLSGSGVFQGNGTKGIIRSLGFSNLGSNAISTSQDLIVTAGFTHTAGSLNTNGKLAIDNTAQVYGLPLNLQVANTAVTAMGSLYTVAPVVFGTAVIQYASGLATVAGTRYVSGSNVYLCTVAATFNATPPTSTNLQATFTTSGPTLLFIGTVGNLGTNIPFNSALSITANYFHGDNVYQSLSTANITAAANYPVHTSGVVNNFRYLGTVAKATVNWDATTQTVRSLNLTQAGTGYNAAPAIAFSIGAVGATGSGAAATAVLFQSIAGPANSTTQKSGGAATITGGLAINSDQGATALAPTNPQSSSGVGAISTTNGGLNYTVAPTVGFSGPTQLNLVTAGGSGYTTAPTITVSGGTLVSGTALTSSSFTITVNNGQVVSVYLNATATYSAPPTLAFTGGGGSGATLAFPAGCWPAATAIIGANGQLTNFSVTNSGYGYSVAPTVGFGPTSGTALGGTFTTAATAPTARIALYNLTLNFFAPATTAVVNGDDAAIPASRKINVLTLAGNGRGLNLTSPLTLIANSAALALTASGNAPGNVLDLGGNNLYCSGNGFAGLSSTFGTTNTYIKNGSMTLTGRGAGSSAMTFNYPFSGTFSWNSGGGTNIIAGSSATIVTVSDQAAPTNTTVGTGIGIGNRAFRVQTNAGSVLGINPIVTLNFNSDDALTGTQNQLFVSEAPALAGPWTTRSTASGSGSLPATGSRSTATVAPGPISSSFTDRYYAWSTAAPTVTNVSPLTLCANSSAFTITGTDLTGVTAVDIGGTSVLSFTVVSATSITGVAGNADTGVVNVIKNGITFSGAQTVTVNPSPPAPLVTPTSATIILGGTAAITASGGAGTFNWYNAATGGTSIFTGASFSQVVCSGNIWVAENNGTCEGMRTLIPITITPTTVSATPANFCGTGGADTLTALPASGTITYTWTKLTPSASLPTTAGSTVYTTITETSDFQLVATAGTCTETKNISVGVYALPSATVTTSASGVCPGTSATINSGLSAGNFTSSLITHAPRTAPGSAVTLVSGGAAVVAQTSGDLDDGGWGSIPVGFNFNFFGTSYNTINVGTNGTVMFGTYNGTSLADFSFTTLPSASEPLNMIALLAMDNHLTTSSGLNGSIRYWTEGFAPNRRFIISYESVREYGDTKISTTQGIFYETTGIIEVHVTSSNNVDRNKLVGINNGNGTIGALAYASGTTATTVPQNPITTAFAYRFSPPANYTTVWTADTGVTGPFTIASGTNIFSQSVAPSKSTTYSISYTNTTTGCANAPGSATVLMSVLSSVAPASTVSASPSSICAGNTVKLTSSYIGSKLGMEFQWQVSVGGGAYTNIAGATDTILTVTPSVNSDYRCNITACGGTAVSSSSVIVTANPLPTAPTATSGTQCGSGIPIIAVADPNLFTSPNFNWYTDASGGTLLQTNTSTTYLTSISTTTTFYVSVINPTTGCESARTPLTITVNTPPSALSLSQGFTKPKCDARVDSLMASGGVVLQSAIVGVGTATNTAAASADTDYPAPYGAYYENARQQYLIRASELSALGLVSGSELKALAFDVTTLGTSGIHTAYTISIGNTSQTAIATWESGLTTVYGPVNYQPVSGSNLHTFNTPFVWNGTSNIIVQVCHTNDATSSGANFTQNAQSKFSTTAFNSSLTYRVDNISACSSSSITYTEAERPNMIFTVNNQQNITWSPTAGLFTDRAASAAYTSGHATKLYSKPSTTTKYYAQAQNGICIVRDSIVDSAKATTDMVILALGSASGASAQCTDGGWTYYGTASDPDKLIFAIQKGAWTNGNETVTIGVNGSPYSSTLASNGPNQQHRSWLMGRDWDVTAATQPGSAVLVRFFYDPADTTAVNTDRDAAFAALPGGTLAVKTPFEWFKTTTVPYNAGWRSSIVGNKFPATHIKLTPTYGTQNGVNYVEFSVASFSGGTGGAGFGPSGGGGAGVGLPVTWAGFDVKTAEVGNELTWKTASEQNTDYFEVQYSYDAKEFIAIPEHISAAGNSADLRTYNFTHTDFAPYVYYRIKQVDLDGKFDYSAIKLAKRAAGPSFVVNVFPIPMQEDNLLHVSAKGIDKSTMSITMTDITGKVIRHLSYIPSSESIKESFDMSPLTPGLYFIEVQNGQGKETFKVSR